jgi:predicted nuclease of predicted toxin-antitoxin system
MIIWVDAQLSPAFAPWLAEQFGIEAYSVKWLGFRDARDDAIFAAARLAGAVVLTKDVDFVDLVQRRGTPPQVIWVTLGNTSNAAMKEVFLATFEDVRRIVESGEPIVQIAPPE